MEIEQLERAVIKMCNECGYEEVTANWSCPLCKKPMRLPEEFDPMERLALRDKYHRRNVRTRREGN